MCIIKHGILSPLLAYISAIMSVEHIDKLSLVTIYQLVHYKMDICSYIKSIRISDGAHRSKLDSELDSFYKQIRPAASASRRLAWLLLADSLK